MKNETLTWIIVVIAVLFILFGGFGTGFLNYSGMGGMMYGDYGYGMMFYGWLYGILILVALVLLIAWLIKQIKK